jgi:heat shock protein HtpX
VKLTGDPFGLASALRKLEQAQISWVKLLLPGGKLPGSAVFRTHPNTPERIARLLALTDAPAKNSRPPAQPKPGWHFTA